jgi:hypothetical protein|tara:strand:+ start:348 stop:638 length:291 start_codon:yes stop_codon:yes gene_type:complete
MPNPRVPNYILTKTKKALTLAGGDCIGQDELIEAQAELADVLHWMCGNDQGSHVALSMELPQFFQMAQHALLENRDPSEFSNKELLEVVETHKPKS